VFALGRALHFEIAAGEGGAANTLPWLHATGGGEQEESLAHVQFGFWLNNPGMGNVTFDATAPANRSMTWRMHAAAYLDYIVVAPSAAVMAASHLSARPFELLERFTSWVGRSPGLPDYALGYWHSKVSPEC
jgi:alpha-glucosidase (family GH31 glycosyl hydrolase)